MSLLKKIFGTLTEKPWEQDQAVIDSGHSGKTFEISNQMSAVIIIFGVSTTLFSLIFTGYLYSLPPEQDTTFILKTNLLWINTLVLILVTIFFGFTNCPDICPMTLNKMDIALNRIKKNKKKDLKVFFISVDPKRDTPEVIKDYLRNFDNEFVGITGDPGEIFLLSQSWGIISQKIFFENGDYNVDHSSPVILLKDGKYIAKISHRDDIKKSINLINKYLSLIHI